MVHPSVPCMLVTPICPHSLSFRSIVVPSGVEITVCLYVYHYTYTVYIYNYRYELVLIVEVQHG